MQNLASNHTIPAYATFNCLGDAEAENAKHPRLKIPSLARRQSVDVGDVVKLAFKIVVAEDAGPTFLVEHLSVEVIDVFVDDDRGRWGELVEQSTHVPALSPGCRIYFEHRHVIDIREGESSGVAA